MGSLKKCAGRTMLACPRWSARPTQVAEDNKCKVLHPRLDAAEEMSRVTTDLVAGVSVLLQQKRERLLDPGVLLGLLRRQPTIEDELGGQALQCAA